MLNEDSLERELSCGICFELYNEPLQFPCMHTFCKDCVKDIVANTKNKKLKCPDCRTHVEMGKNGIDSLKRNFKLASIVDVYRQTLEKVTTKEASSPQASVSNSESPTNTDKDYEFLSSVIQRSQDDASDPFEPHVIDDLWGTFKRTARKGSHMTDRPPAPPPPRSQTNTRTSGGSSSRPLPPLPSPPQRRSRDLTQRLRPLPPDPPSQSSSHSTHRTRVPTPPLQSSGEDQRLEPSAPPYFTLSESHSGQFADEHVMTDMATLNAPPLPPRSSYPPDKKKAGRMDNRPPIPAPRGKMTKKSQPPPGRHKENVANSEIRAGSLQDGRRPQPPLPR